MIPGGVALLGVGIGLLALSGACGRDDEEFRQSPPTEAAESPASPSEALQSVTPPSGQWRAGTPRCPMPPHVVVGPRGVFRGDAAAGLCVVWAEEFTDERGFTVSLVYTESGERFAHSLPPDQHDFVVPANEAPSLTEPGCSNRRAFRIEVFVQRGLQPEPVGGVAGVAECNH